MSQPHSEPEVTTIDPVAQANARRPFLVHSYGLSDPGRVRPTNEDRFAIVELARTLCVHHSNVQQSRAQYSSYRGHLFMVADGMGGHQGGDVASALSVMTVESFVLNTLKRCFHLQSPEEKHVMKEFRAALLQADARLFEEAAQRPELFGMGTTLTMAFACDWRLLVAHAGDCRCYLSSGGCLQQVTKDQTLVAEMVRHGLLNPEDAAHDPRRHIVTSALGGHEPGVEVEMYKVELQPGDAVLVYSDGLTEMVPDARVGAILAEEGPQRACERLVAEANELGGKDNITVVVANFQEA
jgi:protein phosphatase